MNFQAFLSQIENRLSMSLPGARLSLIFAPLHICFIILMSANQGSPSPINMPLAELDHPKMATPAWGHHNLESQFSALNLISVP